MASIHDKSIAVFDNARIKSFGEEMKKAFKNFDDFKKFPSLTEEVVRERLDEFIPLSVDIRKLIYFIFRGSTSEPFIL